MNSATIPEIEPLPVYVQLAAMLLVPNGRRYLDVPALEVDKLAAIR